MKCKRRYIKDLFDKRWFQRPHRSTCTKKVRMPMRAKNSSLNGLYLCPFSAIKKITFYSSWYVFEIKESKVYPE